MRASSHHIDYGGSIGTIPELQKRLAWWLRPRNQRTARSRERVAMLTYTLLVLTNLDR